MLDLRIGVRSTLWENIFSIRRCDGNVDGDSDGDGNSNSDRDRDGDGGRDGGVDRFDSGGGIAVGGGRIMTMTNERHPRQGIYFNNYDGNCDGCVPL